MLSKGCRETCGRHAHSIQAAAHRKDGDLQIMSRRGTLVGIYLPSNGFWTSCLARFEEATRRHAKCRALRVPLTTATSGAKNNFGPSFAALANSATKEVFIPTSP
jgi:hypothetical protein